MSAYRKVVLNPRVVRVFNTIDHWTSGDRDRVLGSERMGAQKTWFERY